MANTGRPQDVWKASAAGRTPGPAAPRARTGKRPWFWAALAVVGLAGVIAGLLVYLWPEPPPDILAVPIAAFDHPDWQPNPWAEADARGFLDRARGDSAQTFQAQEKVTVLRELDRVADAGGRRPLVVHLSALGVAEDGKVSLIPGHARPDDPGTWLALDDVLSRLRRAPGKRLLILDVRPVTDPRAVITGEDVNVALTTTLARLAEAGDLPFLVLTANTPPDGPPAFHSLRRTAFGLALAQAAGGAADGWNPERDRDGRVSARELGAYVRELTHHASTTAGFAPQVPRLHGSGPDFDLFRVPRGGPPPLPALPDPEPYPEWLKPAWDERGKWVGEGLHLRAPRLVRHLDLAATRAERRWLAGDNPDAIRATFEATFTRLREAKTGLGPVVPPAGSVARARLKPGVNPAAARGALEPVFDKIRETPNPARDKAVRDKELTALMAAAWQKPPDAEPFDATAAAVFKFARDLDPPTHDQIAQLERLVSGFKPRPRHAELLALGMIAALQPNHADRGRTIPAVIEAAAEAEEAAAIDGRCLPWVRDPLGKADVKRRDALRKLFDPKSENKDREEAVRQLEGVASDYRSVRAIANVLVAAIEESEETRAVLVNLAVAYPFDVPPHGQDAATTWQALVEDYLKVRTALRTPTDGRLPEPGELDGLRRSLRANRVRLVEELRVPPAGTVRQCDALLRWPGWSAGDRTVLRGRLAEAERAAARRVIDGWPKEPPGRELRDPDPAPSRVADAVGRRIDLLRLAEVPGADDLKRKWEALGPEPQPAAVRALAREVWRAGRRETADAYAAAGTDHAKQARMSWAVDPDDVPAYPHAGMPNPEHPERVRAERAFHEWLAEARYRADEAAFAGTGPALAAAAGCRQIARDYADAFRASR